MRKFFFLNWHDLDRLPLLAADLRQVFEKWFPRVLSNVLTRNLIFDRVTLFSSLWFLSVKSGVLLSVLLPLRDNEPKNYGFRQRRLVSFIKTAFYVLPTKVWRKNWFLIKSRCFIFFGFWVSIFLVMVEKFGSVVGNSFYVSSQRVEENGYFENCFTFIGF